MTKLFVKARLQNNMINHAQGSILEAPKERNLELTKATISS